MEHIFQYGINRNLVLISSWWRNSCSIEKRVPYDYALDYQCWRTRDRSRTQDRTRVPFLSDSDSEVRDSDSAAKDSAETGPSPADSNHGPLRCICTHKHRKR